MTTKTKLKTLARPRFENVSNKRRLSIDQMLAVLCKITKNTIVNIRGEPCYVENGEVRPFGSATALFAWIDKFAEVDFRRGGVTKEEFFEGVCQRLTPHDWASSAPHFPPIKGVYYTCPMPKAKKTGWLDKLLARFSPATEMDRELLRSLFITPFWGGPPGQRPLYTITTDAQKDQRKGTGAGKTTIAEMVSRLCGGYVSVRPSVSADRTLSVLLSPSSWPRRIALIDNLKSYRFSSDLIESLVTGEEINGHRLHHGHASRPNLLTWLVTINGASFSKDMAERSVVIFLLRPIRDPEWYAETVRLIEEHRDEIVAEIRWYLERPPKQLAKVDRWPLWCREVLARLNQPDKLLALIESRRAAIDEDDADAEETVEHVRACLAEERENFCADTSVVEIPALLLARWLRRLKTHYTDRQASLYLSQLQHPRLRRVRNGKRRAYLWVGSKADPDSDTPPVILTYSLGDK
ncbi:MAG: hypothetical protein U0840_31170 [Gemmataceae bacterium]